MKVPVKISLFVILFVLIAVLFAGCTQQQAQPKEVKIGAVVSLTGTDSNLGNSMWQGAQLAAEEINANGGIFVKEFNTKIPVKVIAGDDESKGEGGQKAVTNLILAEEVTVLVGGYSSAVVPVYEPIVLEHKVPFIISGASNAIVTRRTDIDTSYFFHHCPTTIDYGAYTTMFVDKIFRPVLNTKFNFTDGRPVRLGLLYQDTAFGQGVISAVNKTISDQKLNIQIVIQQPFKRGETDFRTALTAVKAAKPDVVYVAAGPSESIVMLPQARRDVGLDTIFLAVENNDDSQFYTGIKQYGEYSVIESRHSPYTAPKDIEAASTKYKDAFKAKYASFPGMMATSTYEAVYIAAKAVENAGTLNRTAVREALVTMKMPQIVEPMENGEITFSKDYRESKFILWVEQLFWDEKIGECRPKIVWPENKKQADFVIPEWYKPGSS